MMSKERKLLERWIEGGLLNDSVYVPLLKETKELLAQPEQEPVAWITGGIRGGTSVGWYEENIKNLSKGTKLYTSPPTREPLSDKHLTSAAPELLEALENWINALDDPSEWMKCRDDAKKAIAKAHGIGEIQ